MGKGLFEGSRGRESLYLILGRRKLSLAIDYFQVLENNRGRFAIISLEYFKGRKLRIFISEGSRGSGWRSLAKEISAFLLGANLGSQKASNESQIQRTQSGKKKRALRLGLSK